MHGERSLYESAWVNLRLVDVEVPGGPRFDHHVVRMPQPAAGTVVFDPDRGVLLLWRHRFITDTWGWEMPGGSGRRGRDTEQAAAAARRSRRRAGGRAPLRPADVLPAVHRDCDQTFHLFLADGAEHVGDPLDPSEAERVEWVPVDAAPRRDRAPGGSSTGSPWSACSTGWPSGRLP